MRILTRFLHSLLLLGAVSVAAPATAATIPYPNIGTENPFSYSFYAATTGSLTLYLTPSSAGYDNELFITVGNVTTDTHLHSHGSVGDTFSIPTIFGQPISFSILDPGGTYSSLTGANADGFHHLYFTRYTSDVFGLGLAPNALNSYYAFEDLPGGGDKDYNDLTFVSTRITAGIPEPSTWALMLAGLVGIGVMARRRRASLA